MINNFQAVILSIVQALTEFLPVSSSGHLVLTQKLLDINTPPIFFDTLIHIGTLFAVLFYLRKELIEIIFNLKDKFNQKLILLIILGTSPIAIVGVLFKDNVEDIFNSLYVVGYSLIFTALVLWSTKFFKNQQKDIKNINWKDSLFVGFFQALAFLPGVSRSGSTISAGLFRKINRESAFKFSFLLAIPAFLGALFIQLIDIQKGMPIELSTGLIGLVVSFVFGLLALKLLEKVLLNGKLFLFGIYCFLLGIFILIFLV